MLLKKSIPFLIIFLMKIHPVYAGITVEEIKDWLSSVDFLQSSPIIVEKADPKEVGGSTNYGIFFVQSQDRNNSQECQQFVVKVVSNCEEFESVASQEDQLKFTSDEISQGSPTIIIPLKWGKVGRYCVGLFDVAKGKPASKEPIDAAILGNTLGRLHLIHDLVHGDLNLGNIFYSSECNTISLIDNDGFYNISSRKRRDSFKCRAPKEYLRNDLSELVPKLYWSNEQVFISSLRSSLGEQDIVELEMKIDLIKKDKYSNSNDSIPNFEKWMIDKISKLQIQSKEQAKESENINKILDDKMTFFKEYSKNLGLRKQEAKATEGGASSEGEKIVAHLKSIIVDDCKNWMRNSLQKFLLSFKSFNFSNLPEETKERILAPVKEKFITIYPLIGKCMDGEF